MTIILKFKDNGQLTILEDCKSIRQSDDYFIVTFEHSASAYRYPLKMWDLVGCNV